MKYVSLLKTKSFHMASALGHDPRQRHSKPQIKESKRQAVIWSPVTLFCRINSLDTLRSVQILVA